MVQKWSNNGQKWSKNGQKWSKMVKKRVNNCLKWI